jgi:hypothetical protein
MRRVSACVATRASALFAASTLAGLAVLGACAPAAQAQIDPYRQSGGRETAGIWQRGADGAPVLVGEVYDEGVPGGAQHWVYFEDYASDQPITLERGGAAYPGLGAFLDATRRTGSRYVAMSNTSGRCDAAPVCVSLPVVADALLKANEPEKSFGASQSLSVTNAAAGARHALLRFDAGRLPPGARVVSAALSLTRLLGAGAPRVHGVAAPWDEATVSWSRFARAGAELGAGPFGPYLSEVEATVPATGGATTAETNLRALVQAWVDGTRPNHGLFLSRDEGEESVVFASRESPDARVRPRLEVCSVSCEQTCATPCGRDEVCAGGACVSPDDSATCFGEAPPAADCSEHGIFMHGRCYCAVGFEGPNCEIAQHAVDCSEHGVAAAGRCYCDSGYDGDHCEITLPPLAEVCSGRGVALHGSCYCAAGFAGPNCELTLPPPAEVCSGRGVALHGTCYCDAGFEGPNCEVATEVNCPNDCSGAGVCAQGRCFCLPGFGGEACTPL